MTQEKEDNLKEDEIDETSKSQEEKEAYSGDEFSQGMASGDSPEFKWYVVHVLSGYENKVKRTLRDRIINHKLTDSFARVFVPEEAVTTSVGGKKRTIKKKFFPGYILIKMIMNDRTWHLVKNTDKITGFIGSNKNNPSPLSEDEAAFLLGQAADGFKSTTSVDFSEGDNVRVIEGPFTSFVGVIENVSDKGKVRVQVSIFGRNTPVELDFTQIEKV